MYLLPRRKAAAVRTVAPGATNRSKFPFPPVPVLPPVLRPYLSPPCDTLAGSISACTTANISITWATYGSMPDCGDRKSLAIISDCVCNVHTSFTKHVQPPHKLTITQCSVAAIKIHARHSKLAPVARHHQYNSFNARCILP